MPCCDAYRCTSGVFDAVSSCLCVKVDRNILMARAEGAAVRK